MEVELKLLLAPSDVAVFRRLDLLQRYAVSKPRTRRLTSTYFDTPALDLHRHGLELRVRRDGRQWVQTPAHLYLGRDREALEWARRSVLERPQHAVAHSWVAAAAANLGDTDTARAALAEFSRRLPSYTISSFRDERLCANDLCRAQRERYYAGLAKAGLPE